jgi:uncharacterized protein YlxP (DUF503 family)
MHAAALRLELRIPDVRSLKEKRRRIKALMAALENSSPIGVAEVGHQDEWKRSTVGVAMVTGQASHLEQIIGAVQRLVLDHPGLELIEMGVAYMEEP